MDNTEAFKIVLNELKKNSLLCGHYDARHGNEHFMYGIATVMEAIAVRADDTGEIYDGFEDEFLNNMTKSEERSEDE